MGPNNDEAAKEALQAWPGGLQVGGGITLENAQEWLSLGASKVSFGVLLILGIALLISSGQVIVTSYLFPNAKFSLERLAELAKLVGKDKLVVDVR